MSRQKHRVRCFRGRRSRSRQAAPTESHIVPALLRGRIPPGGVQMTNCVAQMIVRPLTAPRMITRAVSRPGDPVIEIRRGDRCNDQRYGGKKTKARGSRVSSHPSRPTNLSMRPALTLRPMIHSARRGSARIDGHLPARIRTGRHGQRHEIGDDVGPDHHARHNDGERDASCHHERPG